MSAKLWMSSHHIATMTAVDIMLANCGTPYWTESGNALADAAVGDITYEGAEMPPPEKLRPPTLDEAVEILLRSTRNGHHVTCECDECVWGDDPMGDWHGRNE